MTRSDGKDGFCISTTAAEISVREALIESRRMLSEMGIDPEALGTLELILAEALNNIAEHAYAGLEPGPLVIDMQRRADTLNIHLRDKGRPMPGDTLPKGRLPDSSGTRGTLPEGGFGWFLIRDLTDSITYRRDKGENHLHLVVSLNLCAQ
ncbi:MAG: ATP-binding protein [Rhodobacteraceae bacterium]|nr:ATP-binding protein [Paracoccaceae bacterium]